MLGDQVPNDLNFDIGYYDGSQHSKIWLCSNGDLEAMYRKYPRGEITLWCDGRVNEDMVAGKKRKRDDSSTVSSKRQKREDKVDSVFEDLQERHGDDYDRPQLRLWARMIVQDVYNDLENPPDSIPPFGSTPVPRQRKNDSVSSAISGAAVAITKALSGTPTSNSEIGPHRQAGVSPGKAIELRMKNYEQLRYVQQLYDDGILSVAEYDDQKQGILGSLKRL